MVRSEREISDPAEIEGILRSGRYATMSLCDGDEPYLVTMNYGYDPKERAMYFHCAKSGRKLDIIRKNPHACVTVIKDRGYMHGKCDHAYSSVVIHGSIKIVEGTVDKIAALGIMIDHLEEDPAPVKERMLQKQKRVEEAVVVLRLDIEEIHGRSGN